MDETPTGRPPAWTDADAGRRSDLDERLAPLRSAAVGGLGLALLLGLSTVPVWQATDGTPWAGLVLAAATLAALAGAGLAELAHRVCHVVLAGPPRQRT